MLSLLRHPVFARLFAAQVAALLGGGLLTVALGLLAHDLAGGRAGLVLGAAYTIKMVAYVGLAPLAQAAAERLPRRAVLVGADLARLAVALCLPFVGAVWQVYVLIFVLQAASATFTPAFQALIPDVLRDEARYTRALSLSRLAYDLENLVSPALAGLALSVMSYHALFVGTGAGFAVSAALVLLTALPARRGRSGLGFGARAARGLRLYLATPRLRGLLALTLTAAAGGAFVLVNTVVLVRAEMGAPEEGLALAMAAFGGGSMLAALALPRLLGRMGDRRVMLGAAAALTLVMVLAGLALRMGGLRDWPGLLASWAVFGVLYSAILTPSGRLLRRSSGPEARPALFAAQFALSHACWLVTYPLAGWAGVALGLGGAMLALAVLAGLGVLAGARLWPPSTTDSAEGADGADRAARAPAGPGG